MIKRILLATAILIPSLSVGDTQTFLGNCGVNQITGIQVLSNFSINVWCQPVPSSCSDTLDFTQSCNSQYIGVL